MWPVCDSVLTLGGGVKPEMHEFKYNLGPCRHERSAVALKDYSAQQEPTFKGISIMLQAASEREEGEKEGNLGDKQYSIQLNTIRVNESTQH